MREHGLQEREYWVKTLVKIIDPVLTCGADRSLKQHFPHSDEKNWVATGKDHFAYIEAVARTLVGAAPWLGTHQLAPEEEALRQQYAELARRTIDGITDPTSPDYEPFVISVEENRENPFVQTLVDAAFLAHGVLRAKEELFDKLEQRVKNNLIFCLKETRKARPAHNNWILFSGMVEAALFIMGEQPDLTRVDYCLFQHEQWYKGDGIYGDGAAFHWDYYNSYVIQPMMVDIARIFEQDFPENDYGQTRLRQITVRAARYAQVLERLIAPDGSFPVVGRSVTYRTGAFQLLAQAALQGFLPEKISPAQVRCALTQVIHRCFDAPDNFDAGGWLRVGVCGDQPDLAEPYICTGSLYLCTAGFLPLGLPQNDRFWNSDYQDYTACKIWSGKNVERDHSI